ncbi:MAG TPA: response regulator [Kiritimatiellia bacterium]|nr:response regulator [Kiritimatiellia bacterium]HNS80693.1 response regulator [Kiritimatiellia bacterium]HPA78239.1 response regulator [Kiritimatiellia bacterium]HQQ04939.1 response regulator [Kiritimatiellia bacterium]
MNILVIEDNDQNMYLTEFLLSRHGHSVLKASNGADGIALARQSRPDAILLDIQLPGMDGYEIAGVLKNDEVTRHIPVIAVTSYAMRGDREKVLAAGCEGYIEKPINPDTFMKQILSFIPGGQK